MSKEKKRNRQAIRTRRLLQEALLHLLEKKSYQKITVTDITGRADLARATFYTHFETKDDLLLSYINDVFEQHYSEMAKWMDFKPDEEWRFFLALFEYWQERGPQIQDVLHLVDYRRITRLFEDYHRRLYLRTVPPEFRNDALDQYLLAVLTGITTNLLLEWLENGMKQSPEVMSRLASSLINREVFAQVKDKFQTIVV